MHTLWHEDTVTAILLVGLSVTVYLSYRCLDRNHDAERYWQRHNVPVAHVIRACRYILYVCIVVSLQLFFVKLVENVTT